MTSDRYTALNESNLPLTKEEVSEGWHFCTEFDGLLVGPACTELKFCSCLPKDHPVYKTIPKEFKP